VCKKVNNFWKKGFVSSRRATRRAVLLILYLRKIICYKMCSAWLAWLLPSGFCEYHISKSPLGVGEIKNTASFKGFLEKKTDGVYERIERKKNS
jgi:hypothetical protein